MVGFVFIWWEYNCSYYFIFPQGLYCLVWPPNWAWPNIGNYLSVNTYLHFTVRLFPFVWWEMWNLIVLGLIQQIKLIYIWGLVLFDLCVRMVTSATSKLLPLLLLLSYLSNFYLPAAQTTFKCCLMSWPFSFYCKFD